MTGSVTTERRNFSGYAMHRFIVSDGTGRAIGVSDTIYATQGLAKQEGEKFLEDYSRAAKLRNPAPATPPAVA